MMYRMLDDDNDWCFGQGIQSYCKDEKAIETGVQVYLRAIQGEVWMDGTVGLPWISMMASKDLKPIDLLTIRDYILSYRGILGVKDLDIERNENRKIKLKYKIQTVYNYTIEGSTDIGLA